MTTASRAETTNTLWLLLERDGPGVRVARVGDGIESALGVSAADVIANSATLLRALDADDRPASLAAMIERAQKGDGWATRTVAGRVIEWSVGEFQDGSASSWVLRGQIRSDVADARRALADRLASLGTLAAGLAHEMNNPLSYVLANLQFVLEEASDGALQPDAERWLEPLRDAVEGAERIREIVRDMQAFHRASNETVEPIDPLRALDAALLAVREELRPRARLIKSLAPVPAVVANEARLRQVFVKLLLNAIQAVPANGTNEHQVEVVSGVSAGGSVFIEVRDSGEGIAPHVRARMFDPFFTTRPVGSGIGLGLFVCNAFITTLGGEITVQSEAGRGARIRVTLPVAPEGVVSRPGPASDVVRRAPHGRVLVIDDEPLLARAVRRALRDAHDVESCTDASEGLRRLLAGEHFDVVLCDLTMPGMDGAELFTRVREARAEIADRFVFVTGGAFTESARAFLASVPNARLEKPFAPDDLRAIVAAAFWAAQGRNEREVAGGR